MIYGFNDSKEKVALDSALFTHRFSATWERVAGSFTKYLTSEVYGVEGATFLGVIGWDSGKPWINITTCKLNNQNELVVTLDSANTSGDSNVTAEFIGLYVKN